MKSNEIGLGLSLSLPMVGLLCALTSTATQAGTMGPVEVATGHLYISGFGGGGSSTNTNLNQYGTAFFLESLGGPLAVNGFGSVGHRDVGLGGANIGYEWSPILLSAFQSSWSVSPAVELEGYYLGKGKFLGNDIVSDPQGRLDEHDFRVSLPMTSGVFLGNLVINFNSSSHRWHPYIGGGIGGAVMSIKNADSLQQSPAEPGVNHFNSNTDDTSSAFAAQGKVGLKFDLFKRANLFVEYRGLYVADTQFVFGSTMYTTPPHAPTSSWTSKLDSQFYNLGAVGIQFIL